ncbi:E3 ubiquitin-protein ligase RNF170-like isoform X2 [Diorhabda carinulata]|uniref:E3 ubiquitin-protein ligase RNF170-like isoform X2 n=1 Tax=Diorhabda carinulata TaxID=1163345 RepID=UPI0025A1CA7D|nr:E3 ubiquitin-protein ligase RNF170-like isoform X2 [Diorhabda carinulata]
MPDLVVRTDNIQVTLSASRIIFIIFVTILFMITSRLWKFTKKRIRRLMRKMKDSAIYNMECPICLNPLQTPVKSDCGHAFCIECLYTFWEEPSWKSICSICRAPLENLRLVDFSGY